MTAVGWFEDPFGRHRFRWYSQGHPTSLVRDDDRESHDRPEALRRLREVWSSPDRDRSAR